MSMTLESKLETCLIKYSPGPHLSLKKAPERKGPTGGERILRYSLKDSLSPFSISFKDVHQLRRRYQGK
jgi:hypothetical protein